MTDDRTNNVDLDFLRRVYDRSGGSLDVEVHGQDVAQEMELDPTETAAVVDRLVRTGFLRDVAAHFRIKITVRTISLFETAARD